MATLNKQDFKLNTGAPIPAVGLGTWQSPPGQVKDAVLTALKAGYRHIDCAFIYKNEAEVGEAFKDAFSSGVCKRADIFVTTKLWCTYHSRVPEGLQLSLDRLGLDYVDLYLVCPPLLEDSMYVANEARHVDALARADEPQGQRPADPQAPGRLS